MWSVNVNHCNHFVECPFHSLSVRLSRSRGMRRRFSWHFLWNRNWSILVKMNLKIISSDFEVLRFVVSAVFWTYFDIFSQIHQKSRYWTLNLTSILKNFVKKLKVCEKKPFEGPFECLSALVSTGPDTNGPPTKSTSNTQCHIKIRASHVHFAPQIFADNL